MLRVPYRVWLLSLLITAVLTVVAFLYIDVPAARHLYGMLASTESLGRGFGSAVLLGFESAVALVLIMLRITRGHLSPRREALGLACLTSICAYAINDSTLKFFFGVPNPAAVLRGSHHAFRIMGGSLNSSFPSGHMVLAGSFAGVFMRCYRRSILPLAALLLLAAGLLVAGDWHFVSDVLAGSFIGVSVGLLAGELWLTHSR